MAQADYIVSNGTGAAVRSDLNGQLAAIVSNNSGATAPATTYAYQWWADTTTNTLKLRNSANSAWIELRQLDGDFTTISVDNGSAGSPSIYFNASGTDTGIFSSGTDAVDISTNGNRRFGIASGGDITVFGGNVTLNAQGDLRFADSDSSNFIALQAPATISSNVTLTLPSADGSNGQVLTTNGSGTLSFTTPAATSDKITEGNTEAEVVDTGSNGHFKVTTEGTERFRCDSSGRLLVGTSSTDGNDASLQVRNDAVASNHIQVLRSSNTAGAAPNISVARSRGTAASPTEVTTDDLLGTINFTGYDGAAWVNGANIEAYADLQWTDAGDTTDNPGRLVFSTTTNGATLPTEALRITHDQVICYNQPTHTSKSAAATLTVSELKTQIIQYTGAAATLTLPTGTLTEGGFSGVYTNMTFQYSVINTGSGTCTIGAGTNHTILGAATIASGASGRFAARRTASNTFISYRLS